MSEINIGIVTTDIQYIVLNFFLNFGQIGNGIYFYSNIIGFIGIYFIVAYVKIYLKETSYKKEFYISFILFGIISWIATSLITILLGSYGVIFYPMTWYNLFINPSFISLAIGLFCIAKNHYFDNKQINFLSSLSMLIYIIHCNRIFRYYIRFYYFDWVYIFLYILLLDFWGITICIDVLDWRNGPCRNI